MTFINQGDFSNDPIFRVSLGIPDPTIDHELKQLLTETWDNTQANKHLYFKLYTKTKKKCAT